MPHAIAVAILFAALPLAPKLPEKTLTAFPLRELSPEKAVKELEKYAKAGAVLTPVPREKTLLVYADAPTTKAIEYDLEKLGEPRLHTNVFQGEGDPEAAAVIVKKWYPADKPPTLVPLPAEKRILVYADTQTTGEMFTLLWPAEKVTAPEPTFAVDFRDAPWKDVIEWYSKISGRTFISAITPPGKCTLTPGKEKRFTLGEVTDMLIEVLEPQKLRLMRRDKSWFIWPTDEGSPDPYLFPRITLDELPKYGKHEIVQVIIPLPASLPALSCADEVKKVLGRDGSLLGLEKPNGLLMMATGGSVRRVLAALKPVLERGPKKP